MPAYVCACEDVLLCALFLISVCLCVCVCVIVLVSWYGVYLCGSRQSRQGIMNYALIPLCTAPFTYPRGEDDGVELACQYKCFEAPHAVSVLLVCKGIKLGEQALWHH